MIRSRWFVRIRDETVGFLFAGYLRLLGRTNRFCTLPADIDAMFDGHVPMIVAMWHGSAPDDDLVWPKSIKGVVGDHLSPLGCRRAGGRAASSRRRRGARLGRTRPTISLRKGGVRALIALKRYLDKGFSVAMTADVPKKARVAGLGIVTLAKISGRTDRADRRRHLAAFRIQHLGPRQPRQAFWPRRARRRRSHLCPARRRRRNAAGDAQEGRGGLDDAHRRAYALFGAKDPGADLRGQ